MKEITSLLFSFLFLLQTFIVVTQAENPTVIDSFWESIFKDGLEKNLLQELSSKSLNQDQVQNIHKTFDLNKDEVLDRAEQLVLSYSLDRFLFQNKYQMKDTAQAIFDVLSHQVDLDKNGVISLEELVNYWLDPQEIQNKPKEEVEHQHDSKDSCLNNDEKDSCSDNTNEQQPDSEEKIKQKVAFNIGDNLKTTLQDFQKILDNSQKKDGEPKKTLSEFFGEIVKGLQKKPIQEFEISLEERNSLLSSPPTFPDVPVRVLSPPFESEKFIQALLDHLKSQIEDKIQLKYQTLRVQSFTLMKLVGQGNIYFMKVIAENENETPKFLHVRAYQSLSLNYVLQKVLKDKTEHDPILFFNV